MKIEKISTGQFDLIPAFLENTFSSPSHWPDWNSVVSRTFQTDFFYLGYFENNELTGICPVHCERRKSLQVWYSGPRHFLIPYGGWIFNRKTVLDVSKTPNPWNSAFICFSLPVIEQFRVDYETTDRAALQTLLVDLSKEEDKIWKEDVASKRRNIIRKAFKSNVTIHVEEEPDMDLFYRYLSEVNREYGIETFDKSYYSDLFLKSKHIHFDVMWARQGDEVLSGLVMARDKDLAMYWIGMTINRDVNLGQGDLLQWEAIKRARTLGCKIYDLCTIEKERLPHIYQFKKGFSMTEVPFLNFSKRPLTYRILNKFKL
jgi:hypothetical protein